MTTNALMVLGCTSGAGKSWITTALCRWYANQGVKVAPFKAQNMSNHARVVATVSGGIGEIGSAQYFQALAARIEPDVRMNPILLKPESDARSQVVVLGTARKRLSAMAWRTRAPLLWSHAQQALHDLQHTHEMVIIEGAGSPAEINLADVDYVNISTAIAARARCLLVANIDHGGAFAHLYGTTLLMPAPVRAQLAGYVLNRFRGDASLLSPGPEQLESLTGVPTVGVVPMVRDHGLPEEDAVPANALGSTGPLIVVIATPHVSNLDEFEPLRAAGLRVVFARDPHLIDAADWLILAGSKQSRADLAWLRSTGLDQRIQAYAARNRPVLAICGGLQIAGSLIHDPHGLEGEAAGSDAGIGILPLTTHYDAKKHLAKSTTRFAALSGPWAVLSDLTVRGYEIHLGQTNVDRQARSTCRPIAYANHDAVGWQHGSILACYLHGLFENPEVIQRLFGVTPPSLDHALDRMADVVEQAFGRTTLLRLGASPHRHR